MVFISLFLINTVPQQTSRVTYCNQDMKDHDKQSRADKKKERKAEFRCHTTEEFLCLYYRVFTAVQMCVCQALTVNFCAWAEKAKQCMGAFRVGRYWWLPWGIGRRGGMCVWAGNSCSLGVMTTCAPYAWFMDVRDLSTLQDLWLDRQDAVSIPKASHDRCFHLWCKELLWKFMWISAKIVFFLSLLLAPWMKPNPNENVVTSPVRLLDIGCLLMLCIRAYLLLVKFLILLVWIRGYKQN